MNRYSEGWADVGEVLRDIVIRTPEPRGERRMFTSVNFHDVVRIKVEQSRLASGAYLLEVKLFQLVGGEENRLEICAFSNEPLSIDEPREKQG